MQSLTLFQLPFGCYSIHHYQTQTLNIFFPHMLHFHASGLEELIYDNLSNKNKIFEFKLFINQGYYKYLLLIPFKGIVCFQNFT